MVDVLEYNSLQKIFLKGTVPNNLDGFYKGTLIKLFPKTLIEFFAEFVAKIYLPWYGKEFYNEKSGDNVLPAYITPFVRKRFGNITILRKEGSTIHVFPFTTSVKKGIKDDIKVLQLNYDLPQNPPQVRKIMDELVCIKKNAYLGKAYIKEKNNIRTVAFFSLEK